MTSPAMDAFACETRRLLLRPLEAGDEALFQALYTDSETMRLIGSPLPAGQSASQFHRCLAGMHQRPVRWIFLVVVEKLSGSPLGICGVPQFDTKSNRLEVGIVLGASGRSRGVAKEALAVFVGKVFALTHVGELWAEFSCSHPAAERVAFDLGFRPCGESGVNAKSVSNKREWSLCRHSWNSSSQGDTCLT